MEEVTRCRCCGEPAAVLTAEMCSECLGIVVVQAAITAMPNGYWLDARCREVVPAGSPAACYYVEDEQPATLTGQSAPVCIVASVHVPENRGGPSTEIQWEAK